MTPRKAGGSRPNALIGLGVGGLSCALLQAIGYPLDPQLYLISALALQIEAVSFALAGGSATVLGFASAWFAAQRAAARAPVDALRRLDQHSSKPLFPKLPRLFLSACELRRKGLGLARRQRRQTPSFGSSSLAPPVFPSASG